MEGFRETLEKLYNKKPITLEKGLTEIEKDLLNAIYNKETSTTTITIPPETKEEHKGDLTRIIAQALKKQTKNVAGEPIILVSEKQYRTDEDLKKQTIKYGMIKGPLQKSNMEHELIIPTEYHVLIQQKEKHTTHKMPTNDITIKPFPENKVYNEITIIAGKKNAQKYLAETLNSSQS